MNDSFSRIFEAAKRGEEEDIELPCANTVSQLEQPEDRIQLSIQAKKALGSGIAAVAEENNKAGETPSKIDQQGNTVRISATGSDLVASRRHLVAWETVVMKLPAIIEK